MSGRKVIRSRFRLMYFALMVSAQFALSVVAHGDLTETKVLGAFVAKFPTYVEWPSVADKFHIAVLNDKDLHQAVAESTKDKTYKGLPIETSLWSWTDAKKASHTEMLVFPKGTEKETREILESLKNSPTLAVTYGEQLAAAGATINFYLESERLRFEINKGVAESQHLKISAQLLRLGRVIGN